MTRWGLCRRSHNAVRPLDLLRNDQSPPPVSTAQRGLPRTLHAKKPPSPSILRGNCGRNAATAGSALTRAIGVVYLTCFSNKNEMLAMKLSNAGFPRVPRHHQRSPWGKSQLADPAKSSTVRSVGLETSLSLSCLLWDSVPYAKALS